MTLVDPLNYRPEMPCCEVRYGQATEHKYGPWVRHEEGGIKILTRGARPGHVEHFSREWQERTCEKCGFIQTSPVTAT